MAGKTKLQKGRADLAEDQVALLGASMAAAFTWPLLTATTNPQLATGPQKWVVCRGQNKRHQLCFSNL
jgi:hypothetical protein